MMPKWILENQVILFALIGSIGGLFYRFIPVISKFIISFFICSIEFNNTSELYRYFNFWVEKYQHIKLQKSLIATISEFKKVQTLTFAPGLGLHFIFYKKNLIWFYKYRTETKKESFLDNETFHIYTFGQDTSLLKELIENSYKYGKEQEQEKLH